MHAAHCHSSTSPVLLVPRPLHRVGDDLEPAVAASPVNCSSAVYPSPSGIATNWCTSVDGSNPAISGHRKAGHFRRPETAREFYFMGSRTRKDLSLVKPGPPGP